MAFYEIIKYCVAKKKTYCTYCTFLLFICVCSVSFPDLRQFRSHDLFWQKVPHQQISFEQSSHNNYSNVFFFFRKWKRFNYWCQLVCCHHTTIASIYLSEGCLKPVQELGEILWSAASQCAAHWFISASLHQKATLTACSRASIHFCICQSAPVL